jgi:dienelactone hydrolase
MGRSQLLAASLVIGVLLISDAYAQETSAAADVVSEKVYIDGRDGKIPILVCRKSDGTPRPAIIVLSGAPGDLRACTQLVQGLPDEGYVGVTYEPRTRGERPVKIPKPYSIGRAIFIEQIEPTARDASLVLDYLQRQPYIIPGKIGMAGHSAGGITTILACAYDHRLAAGASVCSSGNLIAVSGRLDHPLALLFHIAYGSQLGLELSQDEKKRLNEIDPMSKADKIYPVPFFLGAGSKDTLVLPRDVKALYEKMRPKYASAPEKLVYREIDCQHAGPTMKPLMKEAFDFLGKHLKP